MTRACFAICILTMLAVPSVGLADAVTAWNEITLDAIRTTNLPPTYGSRLLATVHIAIYDALNGIDRTHVPFYVKSRANPASTDREAAVVAAAYTALVTLLPTQNRAFYQLSAAHLRQIPDSRAKQNGIAWGGYVGRAVAYTRSFDGWNAGRVYGPTYQPGYWRPSWPDYANAVGYDWAYLQPFAVPNLESYLPGPPPHPLSKEYADAVNEVKLFGAVDSAVRSADQADSALFWADDFNSVSPPGRWNKVAQLVVQHYGTSMHDNARLFALLNIAMADGCVAAWKCKYRYQLWRPITAIREADSVGNPLIVQRDDWIPLLPTPAFPEYVSGHSTFGGAAAEVLAWACGTDEFPFDLYSEVTNTTRSFSSFTEACHENGRSRIYGGLHFEFANVDGIAMGRKIGKYVCKNVLRPL